MSINHGTSAGYTGHFQDPDEADGKPCQACQEARHRQHKDREKRKYLEGLESLEIDALGTHRRIRALQRLGWPAAEIGRRINPSWPVPKSNVWQILHHERVHVDTARAVDRVYLELWITRGPSRLTEKIAIRKGWAPPAAWDDIDSPDAVPQGMTDKEIAA